MAEVPGGFAQQQQHVPVANVACDHVVGVVDDPDGADSGGGQDAVAVGFVVKRHVARHDGHVERVHGLADALDRADELAHDLGLFGVAEVHVVGGGQRRGAHGGQVAIGFGHGLFAALNGVGLDVARGHVRGEGQRLSVPCTRTMPAPAPGARRCRP